MYAIATYPTDTSIFSIGTIKANWYSRSVSDRRGSSFVIGKAFEPAYIS
jgi:hypothetical protein